MNQRIAARVLSVLALLMVLIPPIGRESTSGRFINEGWGPVWYVLEFDPDGNLFGGEGWLTGGYYRVDTSYLLWQFLGLAAIYLVIRAFTSEHNTATTTNA